MYFSYKTIKASSCGLSGNGFNQNLKKCALSFQNINLTKKDFFDLVFYYFMHFSYKTKWKLPLVVFTKFFEIWEKLLPFHI